MEARRAGHVARSQDLTAGLLLLAATGAAWWAAASLLDRAAWLLDDALRSAETDLGAHAARLGAGAAAVVLPVLLIMWVAAYLAQVAQIGWVFSGRPLRPSWSRIDPRRGLARLFSPESLTRWALDVAKVAVVVTVTGVTLRQHAELLAGLPYLPLRPAIIEVGGLLLALAVRIVIALLLLGVIDLLLHRSKYERDLRMTREQLRDELRQTEGDPLWRRRRRVRHAEIGARPRTTRLLVVGDDVAVALDWDPETMSTPRIAAKGVAGAARRLRELAMRHGARSVEQPALARALHRGGMPGQDVPPELYQAIARALADTRKPTANSP